MLKIVNVWLGLQTSEMPEDWKKEEKLKEASVPLRESIYYSVGQDCCAGPYQAFSWTFCVTHGPQEG